MILTFDLSSLKSGFECVEFLAQKGITISHKLGARILALNSRGIQVSPVVLEDARPGSPLEALLLSRGIMEEQFRGVTGLILEKGLQDTVIALEEDSIIKIVSPLEQEKVENTSIVHAPPFTRDLMAPTSISPHSLLSDRRYIEETTLTFLDSDDSALIISSLKKLTRMALLSGRSPVPLFRAALAKERPEIWKATAATIKDMIDSEFGEGLLCLLSEGEGERRKTLFRSLLKDHHPGQSPLRGEILIQFCIALLGNRDFLPLASDSRNLLAELLHLHPHAMEDMTRQIIRLLPQLKADDLYEQRELIQAIARLDHRIVRFLLEEGRQPSAMIAASWLLSALSISPQEEDRMMASLFEALREPLADPVRATMVKAVLLKCAPRSIGRLADIYGSLEREFQLFFLELLDHHEGDSSARPRIVEILLSELNGEDRSSRRRILRLPLLKDPAVRKAIREGLADPSSLIEAMVDCFAAVQSPDVQGELFDLLPALVPSAARLSFELIDSRHARGDDIEDHILFLAHLLARSPADSDREMEKEIISLLDRLAREEKTYAAKATEALGILYGRAAGRAPIRFIRRIIDNPLLPLESRITILCALLAAPRTTAQSRETIEAYLIGRLKAEDLTTPELSLLLEEINRILSGGFECAHREEIADILIKAIALKLTQPTIHEFMRSEFRMKEPAPFIARYEQNPWTWEEVAQALFMLLKIKSSTRCSHRERQRILHVMNHLVRHYCASFDSRLSKFYLNEQVLFRVLRLCIEQSDGSMAPLVEIAGALMTLLAREKDGAPHHSQGDLHHFLILACSHLESDDSGLRHAIVRYLAREARKGSPSAREVLVKAQEAPWATASLAKLMTWRGNGDYTLP